MAVTLDQIKELRDATGISSMACKKALDATNGDIDKAIETLRKKGEIKNAARADRNTSEGVIAIKKEGGKAAMIKLACETDFVARNDDFINIATEYAAKVFETGENIDLSTEISELSLKMGEKIELADIKVIEAAVIGIYIHSNKKIGVLIGLDGGSEEQAIDVAMHTAACTPSVISPDEIDPAIIAKEREIWTEQLKNEGKPENILDNILKGKEKKFREENALLKQSFVKNPDKTIEQFLEGANVTAMVKFKLG